MVSSEVSVSIPLPDAARSASQQFITVSADGPWHIEIDFGENEAWADVEPEAGDGFRSDIVLSWDRNDGDPRSCTLTVVTASGDSASAVFRQAGAPPDPGPGTDPDPDPEIHSDPVAKWLELPATDDPDLYFITHDMTRSGKTMRSFSLYYSTDDRLSVWVAYPLNKGLIGSGSRTNEWEYDPKVPKSLQPVLFGGYRGGYDRGHQLPSADRYGVGINEKTFYFTNMTPQRGELNQKAWAKLENMVRDWSYSFDTLYVVTGADIRGATEVAYDNQNKAVTVPVGYYKALLGYKKGSSIGGLNGGYIGIGFYFEHRSYSNDANTIMNQSMSINELESRLGYDFFVNLPDKVGADVAARIESEADSWWY